VRRLLSSLWSGVFDRTRREREISEELALHLEMRAADLVAAGLSPAAALRRARVEFGSIEAHKDECRQALVWHLLDDIAADVRYGWRILRRSPGFVAVAVLSLTLGIGVNTAVFSVVRAAVLRPLPLPDADRLVFLETTDGDNSHSYPNYRDLRDATRSFAGLIAYRMTPMQVELAGGPARMWGYLSSGNYFDVLGVKPAAGRLFHPADDGPANASPYVVLSYDTWQRRFARDPNVVGTEIRINRLPYTVLGVAPESFFGTELFFRPELWVPMAMQPSIEIGTPWLENRSTTNTMIIGRLAAGISREQAEADLATVTAGLRHDFPKENGDLSFTLTTPGWVGSELGSPLRAFLFGLLLLASFVLLIACANLASQLLARSEDRRRELSIRVAIGAGRWRLVRQLGTEAVMLAAPGGALGSVVAVFVTRALSAWHPPVEVPLQLDVNVDGSVLGFAVLVSALATLLFGIGPARRAARLDPAAVLKESGAATRRRWGLRDLVVAGQIALCFAIVSASVLSLQGLRDSLAQPIAINLDRLYIASFDLGAAGYDRDTGNALRARVLEDVQRLPGVEHAAYISALPLGMDQSSSRVFSEREAADASARGRDAAHFRSTPGYFAAAGTPLVAGRDFDEHDVRDSPRVGIVNETFARQVLGTSPADAIGRRFFYFSRTVAVTVVGVVADGKYQTLTEDPKPAAFDSLLQLYAPEARLVLRTSRSAAEILPAVRRVFAAADPALPLGDLGPAREQLAMTLFPTRAAAIALNLFGLLAIILAATGLHGLLAVVVSKQQRELAIRAAVGAAGIDLVHAVLRPTAALIALGCVIGIALSMGAGRLLSSVVANVGALQPMAMIATAAVIAVLAAAASLAPARKALRADPAMALRAE
jgi:predicted permease